VKEEDIVGIKRELYIAPPTTCERRRAYSRYIVGIKQEQVKEEQGAPYAPSLPATALLPVLLLALLPTLQQVQVKAEHTAICSAFTCYCCIKQEQVKEEQGAPYAPPLPATALLPVLLLALLPTLQQVQVKAEHTAICSALPAPAPALYLLYTYYMLSSFRM
jgi:hypothetical protein